MTDTLQRQFEALFADEYEALVDRLEFQTGVREDAEDLAGRAFERLLGQLQRGTDVGELHARLNLVAQGLLFNHYRDEERRRNVEESAGLVPDLDALVTSRGLTYDAAEFSAGFDTAIRALDPEPRDALILTDLRGLTVREAADVLGVSHPTVITRRMAAHTFVTKEIPR